MSDEGSDDIIKLVFILFLGIIFSLITDVFITMIAESVKFQVTTITSQLTYGGKLSETGGQVISTSILAIDLLVGFSGAIGLVVFGEKIIEIISTLFGRGN